MSWLTHSTMARTGANVVTTDYSDWATNCPEYKVTAVQVARTSELSPWQQDELQRKQFLRRIERSESHAAG